MVFSVQQIKYEFLAYIKEFGGDFEDYFVGISSDPKKALFEYHCVDKEKDPWLYKQALTFSAVQTVQNYFLDRLGTDGLIVKMGDENTDCIYIYKKSSETNP